MLKIKKLIPMVKIMTWVISFALIQSVDASEHSQKAKDEFKYLHPCPADGSDRGPCSGYIIGYIIPLTCGGADNLNNMQWQSIAESKAKDWWEYQNCQIKRQRSHHHFDNPTRSDSYYSESREGCFIYRPNGEKQYVAHSYCEQ